jgi:hypothetical protein
LHILFSSVSTVEGDKTRILTFRKVGCTNSMKQYLKLLRGSMDLNAKLGKILTGKKFKTGINFGSFKMRIK